MEKQEGRNRLYPIGLCQLRIAFHIEFHDTDAVANSLLELFEYRVHHFAGLAPRCVEVHQYGYGTFYNLSKCFHIADIFRVKAEGNTPRDFLPPILLS